MSTALLCPQNKDITPSQENVVSLRCLSPAIWSIVVPCALTTKAWIVVSCWMVTSANTWAPGMDNARATAERAENSRFLFMRFRFISISPLSALRLLRKT